MTRAKVCTACHKSFPLSEFYRHGFRGGRQQYTSQCRICVGLRNGVSAKHRHVRYRIEVLTYYSGGVPHCACCGESRLPFLCIDHIAGGGAQHYCQVITGHYRHGIYGWLRRQGYPAGFRVLCFNCNSAIAIHGVCPHEAEREAKLPGKPGGSGGKPASYGQAKTGLALFNLEDDIGETTDVAGKHPEVVERLKALAEKAREDLGDSATNRPGKGVRQPGHI